MAKLALNSPDVKNIDEGVKNWFKWSWLQETVQVQGETMPMNCFSKIREAGRAICDTCNQHINYGTSGKSALKKHVEHPKHIKAWKMQQQNMRIDITPSDNIIVAASPNNPVQPRIPPLCNRVAQDQVSGD